MTDDRLRSAACSGVILYQWDGKSSHMLVGVTRRHASVGAGYGISFGGFADAGMMKARPGTVRPMTTEAYREGEEELGARSLHEAIAEHVLEDYAQPLGGYLVRVDDGNIVHAPVYYAFPVTMEEKLLLGNLDDTAERVGQIVWMELRWRAGLGRLLDAADVTLHYRDKPVSWSAFKHAHERVCVFHPLAVLAAMGRLWNDRGRMFD